jgi:tripartite-type tricarboxylate transporter receptor subunit TctC
MKRRWIALVIGSTFLATACTGLPPDGSGRYPDGDIRLVVAAEAGENQDTVARAVAPCLGERLGTGVIVDNRPGEQGMLATREFVESDWDGHTFLVTSVGAAVVAPVVEPDVGYEFDDFRFVGVLHSAPLILFTAGNGPFDTAEQLFGAARAGGAPVEVANTGASMTEELTLGELSVEAETRLESLRVDSEAELLSGVVAGDYPAGLTTVTAEHLARVESGEIRVLAVGGEIRPRYLPEALTFYRITRATLLPQFPVDTTVIAPDDIADRVVSPLLDALDHCLNTDDVRRGIGVDFLPDTVETHGALWGRYLDLERSARTAQRSIEGN